MQPTDPYTLFFCCTSCVAAFKLNERPNIQEKRQLVDLLQAAGNTSFTVASVNRWLKRERDKKKKMLQPVTKVEEMRRE